MKKLDSVSTDEILRRMGRNLEYMRLEAQIPDSEVVSRGGIKSSTWTNLKAGRNVTIANLIRALRGLDRLSLLEPLVNEEPPESPMSLVDGGHRTLKKRIRRTESSGKGDFRWGDES